MHNIQALIDNIETVIVGKRRAIELAVIALLCRGHCLLEDVPGLGKSMLARALAKSVRVDMKRVQCTPDLLPSDITGVGIFNQKTTEFEFRPGPVFTNIFLADEINRATPRAQSALLECMAESQVSVDGVTHELPDVFMVLATQNPIDNAGTYPLPEAQLDRFFVRLGLGYPSIEDELRILSAQSQSHPIDHLAPVICSQDILDARDRVKKVHLSPSVALYVAQITSATRQSADLRLGASPRGTLALARGAQGLAFLQGKDFVTPAMVKAMAPAVLEHRLIIKPEAVAKGRCARDALKFILDATPPPA